MRGAFLRAMDMKISQSEACFNALSIREVKTSLHRVKMMSEKKNTLKKTFFCSGQGNKEAQLRPESQTGTGGRAAGSG